jgi:ribosomal protein L16 Arg81 hydroxylase
METYWTRRPLVIQRKGEEDFSDLYQVGEIEADVRLTSDVPFVRVARANHEQQDDMQLPRRDVPYSRSYVKDVLDADSVLSAFLDGASIIIDGLNLARDAVAQFCRSLELSLGLDSHGQAFYTPRDSQALEYHHDAHDVFILQISGEKLWRVGVPSVENPLMQMHLPLPECFAYEARLKPGDTLYLPRGWPHVATTDETDSLHLTIALAPYTWIHAFHAAIEACRVHPEFRRLAGSADCRESLMGILWDELAPDASQRASPRR